MSVQKDAEKFVRPPVGTRILTREYPDDITHTCEQRSVKRSISTSTRQALVVVKYVLHKLAKHEQIIKAQVPLFGLTCKALSTAAVEQPQSTRPTRTPLTRLTRLLNSRDRRRTQAERLFVRDCSTVAVNVIRVARHREQQRQQYFGGITDCDPTYTDDLSVLPPNLSQFFAPCTCSTIATVLLSILHRQ